MKAKNQYSVKVTLQLFAYDCQTLFLVGGLGSNNYLAQYLEKKIGGGIDVRQPPYGLDPPETKLLTCEE